MASKGQLLTNGMLTMVIPSDEMARWVGWMGWNGEGRGERRGQRSSSSRQEQRGGRGESLGDHRTAAAQGRWIKRKGGVRNGQSERKVGGEGGKEGMEGLGG